MNIKNTRVWRFFCSIKLAIWLFSFIAFLSVIGTLIPQNKQPAEYIARYGHSTYHILDKAGLTNVYCANWFILLLVLLSLNLIVCLINRFSLKKRSLGTLISHLSILVILTGALIGVLYAEKGYIKIYEGQTVSSFVSQKFKSKTANSISLDFSLRLDDFIYEEHTALEERLEIYSKAESAAGKKRKLLSQIPAEIGKKYHIPESGYVIEILRYVPDFVMDISTKEVTTRSHEPKNPALEVKLTRGESIKIFWVLGAHRNMHKKTKESFEFVYRWIQRRPKDFISKVTVIQNGKEVLKTDIRVNYPLKFGGYTFYQSSYDTKNLSWSGLQIAKDPGVVVVYLGFVLLIMGLCMRFYINPFIK